MFGMIHQGVVLNYSSQTYMRIMMIFFSKYISKNVWHDSPRGCLKLSSQTYMRIMMIFFSKNISKNVWHDYNIKNSAKTSKLGLCTSGLRWKKVNIDLTPAYSNSLSVYILQYIFQVISNIDWFK